MALAVENVSLVVAGDVVGRRLVEIEARVGLETVLPRRREKRLVRGVRVGAIRHRERAIVAAILAFSALVSLRTLQQRQQIVVAPAGVAQILPAIEAEAMTANERHRVGGARAADRLAAGKRDAAVLHPRFRLRRVGPVEFRSEEGQPAPWRAD